MGKVSEFEDLSNGFIPFLLFLFTRFYRKSNEAEVSKDFPPLVYSKSDLEIA